MFNQIKWKSKKEKQSQTEGDGKSATQEDVIIGFKENIENVKKISVVIPNYNYANYLPRRIASIFQQTYPIYELLILDDHSTDHSMQVIQDCVKRYEHSNVFIRVIENEVNSGSVFRQWKKGFTEAQGDYIWMAEADDDCSPLFLESLMKGFEHDRVVLAYAESKRVNEDMVVLREDCRDWSMLIDDQRWNQDYVNDGRQEIKEALSVSNTIPNVSAVVFKKFDITMMDAIEHKFVLSGDWYLYIQLLFTGDIFYCSQSLNYFRKHSGSVSTDIKKDIEFKELLQIQEEVAKRLSLHEAQRAIQRRRYRDILEDISEETKQEVFGSIPKKIAWIVPKFSQGGGGARTILQNANYLALHGWLSDLYIDGGDGSATLVTQELSRDFEPCYCNVYLDCRLRHDYDAVIATYSIHTPEIAYHANVKYKFYFVQDFEPWFESMGDAYLQRERGYSYGLQGISIGNWLCHKLQAEYQMPMGCFPFCADQQIYKRLTTIPKEKAICFIYQPEKPRRCSELGLAALRIVKRLHPEVKLYIYGSKQACVPGFPVEDLQLISVEQCNELYNRCMVGLCISASNPSRIPFEMMAAGLPVVDIYRENNVYDEPEDGILLAHNGADALAAALLHILEDESLQAHMSMCGEAFMKNYPIEEGFHQFLTFMEGVLQGNSVGNQLVQRKYCKPAFQATTETTACLRALELEDANREYLNIKVLDTDEGTFEINVSTLVDAQIAFVRVPVWCLPDQSDIVWYELDRQEDGSYRTISSIGNHQYHRGSYIAHLYTYVDETHGTYIEQKNFLIQ